MLKGIKFNIKIFYFDFGVKRDLNMLFFSGSSSDYTEAF